MWKPSSLIESTLFLSPESPYPLAGGGPMRTASLLHYFARRSRVHLIAFAEETEANPEPYLPHGLVDRVTCIYLPHHSRGTVSRFYRNTGRVLRRQLPLVDRFCGAPSLERIDLATGTERYDVAVIEHFWCAPYLHRLRNRVGSIVLDLHNVESFLHEACARSEPWPHAMGHRVFLRTARRLERHLLGEFDLVLVASELDRQRVTDLVPSARVAVYPNSIPFTPLPAEPEEDVIAFSGNLEYHPNLTAIRYFYREIWPRIAQARAEVRWRLIGKNEREARLLTPADPRVEYTGAVADAVAELARAKVAVVPLLAGSGTRVKIMEAWAAGRAVVSTSIGAEGLPIRNGENIVIADEPSAFARAVLELLANGDERRRIGEAGRATYEQHCCWPSAWALLDAQAHDLLETPQLTSAV